MLKIPNTFRLKILPFLNTTRAILIAEEDFIIVFFISLSLSLPVSEVDCSRFFCVRSKRKTSLFEYFLLSSRDILHSFAFSSRALFAVRNTTLFDTPLSLTTMSDDKDDDFDDDFDDDDAVVEKQTTEKKTIPTPRRKENEVEEEEERTRKVIPRPRNDEGGFGERDRERERRTSSSASDRGSGSGESSLSTDAATLPET